MVTQTIFCLTAISAAATLLSAGTIPAPTIYGDCNGVSFTSASGCSSGGSAISVSSAPALVLTSDSTGVGAHGSGGTGSSGTYSYDIIIDGGTTGDAVPILVQGSLSTRSIGGEFRDVTIASAALQLSFANGSSGAQASVSCGNIKRGEDCSNPTWSGTLSATGWVGYDNFVTLSVSTDIAGAGTAHAFADPHVTIDPTFLQAHPQYSLEISPGVGNELAAAPEPSALLLFAAGIVPLMAKLRKGTRAKV